MNIFVATHEQLTRIDEDRLVTTQLADTQPEALAVHPDAPDRIFCGTFTHGLFRSTDKGGTWERVGAASIDPGEDKATNERRGADGGVSVMSLAIDPSDPDIVWAGTEPSALFRSADGGTTWEQIEGLCDQPSVDEWAFPPRPYTHHVRCIAVDPRDGERVVVGIEAGALLLTTDGGTTWTDRPSGSRRDNHSLATHPAAPGRVYAAAGDGYAESTDGGVSWFHPQDGLDHRYVWGMAVDPADPDVVLVSAATSASRAHGHGGVAQADAYVYRREHGTWSVVDAIPHGAGVLRATLVASAPGSFVVGTNAGMFRSSDAGDTWTALDIDWDAHAANQAPRSIIVA